MNCFILWSWGFPLPACRFFRSLVENAELPFAVSSLRTKPFPEASSRIAASAALPSSTSDKIPARVYKGQENTITKPVLRVKVSQEHVLSRTVPSQETLTMPALLSGLLRWWPVPRGHISNFGQNP